MHRKPGRWLTFPTIRYSRHRVWYFPVQAKRPFKIPPIDAPLSSGSPVPVSCSTWAKKVFRKPVPAKRAVRACGTPLSSTRHRPRQSRCPPSWLPSGAPPGRHAGENAGVDHRLALHAKQVGGLRWRMRCASRLMVSRWISSAGTGMPASTVPNTRISAKKRLGRSRPASSCWIRWQQRAS